MTEDTELALAEKHGLQPGYIKTTRVVEKIVARCNAEAIAQYDLVERTVVTAKGMQDLRKAMDKVFVDAVFMPLQGTKLGFRTDMDAKGGYDWETVRDISIEAMMRGFHPIGNEFNIIGGNFYATQEGLDRKVHEYPGLTNLELIPSNFTMEGGVALVPYRARWLLNGKRDELVCHRVQITNDDGEPTGEFDDQRIPVRVNAGQGPDAILGKAKRKMLARIHERITGQRIPEGDIIDGVGELVPETRRSDRTTKGAGATADAIAAKHASKSGERTREPGED